MSVKISSNYNSSFLSIPLSSLFQSIIMAWSSIYSEYIQITLLSLYSAPRPFYSFNISPLSIYILYYPIISKKNCYSSQASFSLVIIILRYRIIPWNPKLIRSFTFCFCYYCYINLPLLIISPLPPPTSSYPYKASSHSPIVVY